MAKPLTLVLSDSKYALTPTKIERKKIYGWTELRATAPDNTVCCQAGLDSDGKTIVPKGATKMGMMTADGHWMEKSELEARHADGRKAEYVPSSFDGEIMLDNETSVEALLDLMVTSVYQLDGDSAAALAAAVSSKIYAFSFNYRADYSASPAFLIANGTTPFILTGEQAQFEMIGLEEQAALDELDEEVEMEEDELDFSMM